MNVLLGMYVQEHIHRDVRHVVFSRAVRMILMDISILYSSLTINEGDIT